MPTEADLKQDKAANAVQARQVIDLFHEISTLLNADLDRQTLSICVSLIENGVNPEALAVCNLSFDWKKTETVVRELKKDAVETRREIEERDG
ncbi:Mitotic-spindle organizing associated with a ring of gamma-tubulin 1 [Hyphodiscus hymeniophilus]|uniref:Mitotic-spindle organizing protein 1 n=1 Tax=Hyphodiscus hymeniophilus TaxID=353542 RepID=A0A9P7AU14_9HELO|nr:Mitotic-spindle organizing associated with a ring of gamma-tubulin 1 [Hyphodiscus hymeniophilus]